MFQMLRTWGMSFDLSKMRPSQLGMVQGGRKLQARGMNKETPEGFFYPCEQEIEKIIDARVQASVEEKVREAIATLSTPLDVGDCIFTLSRNLPNTAIFSRKGWLWLRLDIFAGTIGSAQSLADLRDARIEQLYLELGGTASEWANGDALEISDYRGRALRVAGQGNELENHEIGSLAGKESHRLSLEETPTHEHEGGDHFHYLPLHENDTWSYSVQPPGTPNMIFQTSMGPSNMEAQSSGPIVSPQGGGQAHPTLGPSAYLAAIAFLGVYE